MKDVGPMVAEAKADQDQAAEAAAQEEYKRLHPDDQKMVQDVLEQHPNLTLATALAHLKEAGM
jgi:hypothetical protein